MSNKERRINWSFAVLALLLAACTGGPAPLATAIPVTATALPPTASPVPATATRPKPTATRLLPTATPLPPEPTATVEKPSVSGQLSDLQSTLFEDHFSSNENGWETGNTSTSYAGCHFQIVNGKYRMAVTARKDYGSCSISAPNLSMRDGTLNLKATIVKSTAGEDELNFGISVRDTSDGRYEFYFRNQGSFSATLWNGSDYQDIHDPESSDYFRLDPDVTNVFSITANNDTFAVSVNGRLLYTVADSTLTSPGKVSLMIQADKVGQEVIVDFDDFVVQEPVVTETSGQAKATPARAAATKAAATRVAATPVPATVAPTTKLPEPTAKASDEYALYFHFGAEGCPYSRKTGPNVERFYQAYKGQVEVYGMAVPGWGTDIGSFRTATGITFPVIGNDGSVDESRIPVLVLVNKRTGARQIVSVGVISYDALASQIDAAVAGNQIVAQSGTS